MNQLIVIRYGEVRREPIFKQRSATAVLCSAFHTHFRDRVLRGAMGSQRAGEVHRDLFILPGSYSVAV